MTTIQTTADNIESAEKTTVEHSFLDDVLFVGHSLVGHTMPHMLNYLLDSQGAEGNVSEQIINGSPLRVNWDSSHSGEFGVDARVILPEGNTEVLVITEAVPLQNHLTWNDSFGYAANFYNLAIESNPNTKVYMYETWHSILSGTGVDVPYDDNGDIPWRDRLDQDLARWESIVDSVNDQRADGAPEMMLIPAGQAMAAMYDAIEAGNVPGITDISDFFLDDIHLNQLGNYFLSMVQYATIYGENPDDLTDVIYGTYGEEFDNPSPALADVMQEIAWDVVTSYANSGVASESDDDAPDDGDDDVEIPDTVYEDNAHVTYAVAEMGDTGAVLQGAFFIDNPDSMTIDLEAMTVTTWDGQAHTIEGVDFLSFGHRGGAPGMLVDEYSYISDAAMAAADIGDPAEDPDTSPGHNAHVTYAVAEMGDTGAVLQGAFFIDNPDSMAIDLEAMTVTTWDGQIHSIEAVDFLSFGHRGGAPGMLVDDYSYISEAAITAANAADMEGSPAPKLTSNQVQTLVDAMAGFANNSISDGTTQSDQTPANHQILVASGLK